MTWMRSQIRVLAGALVFKRRENAAFLLWGRTQRLYFPGIKIGPDHNEGDSAEDNEAENIIGSYMQRPDCLRKENKKQTANQKEK